MSLRASVFIAISLDGFIAREDGSLDWLDKANLKVPKGEDCGYHAFMDSIDVLVMGRHTYEQVRSFGPWPYEDKPVIVLSSQAIKIPVDLAHTVSYSSEFPQQLHARLSQKGFKRLYIDGGITIRRFLVAGLIDDITITVIPVVLGQGKTLFGGLEKDILLQHKATKTYEFGFVQLSYGVEKK